MPNDDDDLHTRDWLNESYSTQLKPSDIPVVEHAMQIVAMFNEINALRQKVWLLEDEAKMWRKLHK